MFRATEMTGPGPEPDVVVYGDIHDAYVESNDGRTLANAGAVGNPLDMPTADLWEVELRTARYRGRQ